MGWERKRGKLDGVQPAAARRHRHQLRRPASATSSVLPSVRYVITLDSDTQLPLEAGRALVGTLAHPLNRPRFDARLQRVTEGYGVLQPRVGVSVVSANRTPFARVFSGPRRHRSVHDRGLRRLPGPVPRGQLRRQGHLRRRRVRGGAGRTACPENTLLSHDLFEGFYARAGLVHRHPPRRRLPVPLSDASPRGSTAGSAATGRSRAGSGAPCPTPRGRVGAEHAAGDRALEDPRQPAPQPDPAGAASLLLAGGLDGPARVAGALDRRWRCWCSRSRPTSQVGRSLGQPRLRRAAARALPGRARQHPRRACGRLSLSLVMLAHQSRRDARRHRPGARADAASRAAACSSG